ncbi:MAG: hypothetical protein VKN56_08365 [Cyanobacteriota bacterium]|nr:hypothetical protein [Cyanobacteriota bacterium]
MSETIYHRYRLKRRTTAGWAANNEVLLAGEPGIEVLVDGTEKIKYGDGVKTWAQLSYAAGGGGGASLSNATPQPLGTATAGTATEASRADHRHTMPNATEVGADASGTAMAAVAAHAAAADPHPGYTLETDSRLSDPRTPTAHKSTHATGGTDALSPADIGAATAAQGAKADTAIQPGNAALTDAREWSAETISQAEAEAGSATTRRAFTAQRVFQAVAAWWAGSASKTKLDGIANGATANSTDADLRDRSTHNGTQPATTITGLAAVATSGAYSDLSGKPDLSQKADLVNGVVPSAQLPGFAPAAHNHAWSTITSTPTTLNGYGITDAAAAAPVQSVAGKTGTVTLAKDDVGLGNVDNTSDANKPINSATAAALAGKASTGSATTSGLTMATARLLGRTTADAGAIEEIQVAGGTFANGTLTLSSLPSSLTADANGNLTFTARWIQSTNGAASAPAHALTGTWFTGGTSTTTKPHFLIEPTGTTSTAWSTAGTGLGVNAASGFTGNLLDLQVNGLSNFRVSASSTNNSTNILIGNFKVGQNTNGLGIWGSLGASRLDISVASQCFFFTKDWSLQWTDGNGTTAGTVELTVRRDAANTLAQRNGTNAQIHRVYNTFTSDTDYELGKSAWERATSDASTNGFISGTTLTVDSGTGIATGQIVTGTGVTSGTRIISGSGTTWTVSRSQTVGATGIRVAMLFGAPAFRVGTEKGSGGGTARALELQTDGTTRLTVAADGSTITAASGTNLVANHRLTGTSPASATATGTAGDIRSDPDYIYICTATDTWKRAAIATW